MTAPEALVPAERLFRTSECLLVAYFLLAALRAAAHGRMLPACADLCVPLIFCGLAWIERGAPGLMISVVRDWASMPFLLLAYWNVDWVTAAPRFPAWEYRWVVFDRLLLEGWHLRSVIECCGAVGPALLELSYLTLYAMPPVLLGIIYIFRRRRAADRFLSILFAGALTAYALLPLFPSLPPFILFPGQDLPATLTLFRRVNLWVLGNLDIHGSVFPSGHVSVAFSAAFGVMEALPGRRWLGRLLLIFATLVAINTVYARYHYAVDGLAGFAISLAASRFLRAWDRRLCSRESGAPI